MKKPTTKSADSVRCTGWMGEAEAALALLRKLTKTARKEKRIKAIEYLSDACDFVEEALKTERSPSPIDPKLSDGGGWRGCCRARRREQQP